MVKKLFMAGGNRSKPSVFTLTAIRFHAIIPSEENTLDGKVSKCR